MRVYAQISDLQFISLPAEVGEFLLYIMLNKVLTFFPSCLYVVYFPVFYFSLGVLPDGVTLTFLCIFSNT